MKNQVEMTSIPRTDYVSLVAANKQYELDIAELKKQNQWLQQQLGLIKQKQFGASSEKNAADQITLDAFNEVEVLEDRKESEKIIVAEHERKVRRTKKDRYPVDLPVETVTVDVPEAERVCPDCGNDMHKIGVTVSREELVLIPATAKIRRFEQAAYACRCCEHESDHTPIIKAEMPNPVISGSFASPEAVAHIAVQKYVMASPLYRQETEWARSGVHLSRQTMSSWLVRVSQDYLTPLYERLKAQLIRKNILHADETTLQVLREDGKPAESKSYMWHYRTSGDSKMQIVLFEYQPDRKHERPRSFLTGFSGFLHTDGFEGYHKLPNVTSVGCLAHLRRKFVDALAGVPPKGRAASEVARGVRYLDKLFMIERELANAHPYIRFKERYLKSRPVLDAFYVWVSQLKVLPKTLLGKAVYYALSQRKYIEVFLCDGRLEISNNRAERSIKDFVIGRKNWLFSLTVSGAKAGAVIYSIIETAKENSINPHIYLTWVLKNAPNIGKPGYATSYDDLLPDRSVVPKEMLMTPIPPRTRRTHRELYGWDEDDDPLEVALSPEDEAV